MIKKFWTIVLAFAIMGSSYAGYILNLKTNIDKAKFTQELPTRMLVTLYSDSKCTTKLAEDNFYKTAITPEENIYKAEVVTLFAGTGKTVNCPPTYEAIRFTLNFKNTDSLLVSTRPWYTVAWASSTNTNDLSEENPIDQVDQNTWENFCAKIEGTPVGTIIPWATKNISEGFLVADGSIVAVNKYPRLFAAIGNTYGGDGISTFGLPDLRGLFIRGVGGNSAALGVVQGDAIITHYHIQGEHISECGIGNWGPSTQSYGASCGNGHGHGAEIHSLTSFPVIPGNDANIGTNETRPINMALNYIIKY